MNRTVIIAGHTISLTAEQVLGNWEIHTTVDGKELKTIIVRGNRQQAAERISDIINRYRQIESHGIDPFYELE